MGMAAAAAAGAAIGMLLAPEKGTELRSKIIQSTKDWLDATASLFRLDREVAEEVKEQAKETVSEIKQGVKTLRENA